MSNTTEKEAILKQLDVLWYKYPNQRLGQIIANYVALPKKLNEVSDSDAYLSLCKANGVAPTEFDDFIEKE